MKEILDRAFCLDFETTDKEAKNAKVCEAAVYGSTWEFDSLVNPGIPIPPETSAVHHIVDEDVSGAPTWDFVKAQLAAGLERTPLVFLIAHNAEYEKTVIGDFVPVLWICTYKCALRVWPDAPAHNNETLRYYLGLTDNRGRNGTQRSHSAMHDAKVTYELFRELLKHATIDELVEWTEQPKKFPKIPIGKFRGQLWSVADNGYLTWMKNAADMDPDLKYAAQQELNRRRG